MKLLLAYLRPHWKLVLMALLLATINQVHVHDKIGMTFSAALRSLLRQDPDVMGFISLGIPCHGIRSRLKNIPTWIVPLSQNFKTGLKLRSVALPVA